MRFFGFSASAAAVSSDRVSHAFVPRSSAPASQGCLSPSRLKMNPKDPKWSHNGPKMVHSASGPQLQRRKPPAALPSLGQSASARQLPLPIKQPKARRFKASTRLEALNQYVATSGCYEVIDEFL